MVSRPALSKGEMDVARVLWDVGPAGVRDVHQALSKEREVELSTVQTYLRRLETKGYATSQLKGRARVYSAKAKPRTVIRETVDELVDRLFGGDSMPLVRHLIEERGIEQKDLDELRHLIDKLDRDGGRS
ncbi:MAG: BlaI/MecI/CopY family transcriptional regulator [Planctomycetales bacterium]|nr:BlaI/MecI/CopY family transcriptional regulator [Planctomycetales bacterium]